MLSAFELHDNAKHTKERVQKYIILLCYFSIIANVADGYGVTMLN